MDNKKQNLTPELKQIYDRVMNTQVAGKTPDASKPTETASPTPSNATPATQSPSPSTPAATPNAPQEGFLSSVPPRPVADNKGFVFTGKKVETKDDDKKTPAAAPTTHPSAGGKKISAPIIGALVVVLLVVWGVFWAKLLGLL